MGTVVISNVREIYGEVPLGSRNVLALFRESVGLSPAGRVAIVPDHGRIHIFNSEGGPRNEPPANRPAP